MKKLILITLLLFILLSSLSVNVVKGQTKIATPAALEPGENLTIYVTVEAGRIEDLYSVEIRDKVPEGFELISGNTSMYISIMDLKSMFWESVGLSYVLKAQKPGVFLLEPANVTFKTAPEDASPMSRNSNRFEVYVIDPATMTLNSEADSSTYPYTLLLGYYLMLDEDGVYKINLKTPEVLRIDKRNSYVLNLETGSKLTYEEFLHSDQFEGDKLEFNISLSKSIWAGLWDRDEDRVSKLNMERTYFYPSGMFFGVDYGYGLELSTNLGHPKWKFGDFASYGQEVIVRGLQDYERVPRVILFGTVPKQILTPEVHVTLTVGPQDQYGDWRGSIHKLEPVMEFSSISKSITLTPITSPSVTPTSTPPISTPSPTVTPVSPTPVPIPSPTPTATEIPTPEEKGVPGFEVIFAIAGLLAVAYLLRRRG
ncbi:MAG: PGF-CTERM sorting domain-containing protein [Methanophagales archaeon]|nr:PGF-CTERM sorting domain-containing protein [Methanophagales archaeon]